MTPAQLATLKTELTTDPLARGYSAMTDEAAANSLNTANRQPNRETLDSGLLMASIVRSEFAALSTADKQYIQLVMVAPTMPLTPTLRTELGNVFGPATTTRANLTALMRRSGSRGEELGVGMVTPSDVADAKRS